MQLIASSATVDYELKEELINLGWGQDVEMISTTESSSGLVSPNTIEYCNILCNTNNRDDESVLVMTNWMYFWIISNRVVRNQLSSSFIVELPFQGSSMT